MAAVTSSGEGPAIVFLHGFPLDSTIWRNQVDVLAQAGYHAITIDMRGFGKSSAVQLPYSIADLADDIEEIRRWLLPNEHITLIGLSMGG